MPGVHIVIKTPQFAYGIRIDQIDSPFVTTADYKTPTILILNKTNKLNSSIKRRSFDLDRIELEQLAGAQLQCHVISCMRRGSSKYPNLRLNTCVYTRVTVT